jgi:hypothetical protein
VQDGNLRWREGKLSAAQEARLHPGGGC